MTSESASAKYTTRKSFRLSPDSHIEEEDDPLEEAAAMILSTIDDETYEKAMVCDTETILQQFVLPKSFIWNNPRVQLLRTLPRDIEDMPGILHVAPFSALHNPSTNNGPLGFGMFDMGGLRNDEVKGTRAETIITTRSRMSSDREIPSSPSKNKIDSYNNEDSESYLDYPFTCSINNYEAAARRSYENGIIELAVKKEPERFERALLTCQRHGILPIDPWLKHSPTSIQKVGMLLASESAELSSSMPMHWSKIDKPPVFSTPSFPPNKCQNNYTEETYQTCLDYVGVQNTDKDAMYEVTKLRKIRKAKCAKVTNSSFRKWRLSVKVGGVSSRHSLIKETKESSMPLHLIANFPASIQFGKTVTIETAQKMDDESNNYLGSYDCRASASHTSMSYEAMQKVKKENRSKRNINVGRTRLIWSSFHQAGNNRIVCTSDLTGEKILAQAAKRPSQAAVFVGLNGKRLSISASSATSSKISIKERVKWTDKEISIGIKDNTLENGLSNKVAKRPKKSVPSNHFGAYCTIDPEEYIKRLKTMVNEPIHQIADQIRYLKPMKYGATDVIKHTPPRFNCLPLDDGYFRVICEKYGSMKPTHVHDYLRFASKIGGDLCSVCWDNDNKLNVLTCIDCGLIVHYGCCFDGGEIVSDSTLNHDLLLTHAVKQWRCLICKVAPTMDAQVSSPQDNSTNSLDRELPSRKSRRTPRLPTRFKGDTQVESNTLLRQTSNNENDHPVTNARPSPKCALCPHSGGAMSALNDGNDTKWTHEICRIWCKKSNSTNIILQQTSPSQPMSTPQKKSMEASDLDFDAIKKNPVTQLCCLCGMGEERVLTSQDYSGLIKCAATGCHVMFHPMCAVLATKLSDVTTSAKLDISAPSNDPMEATLRHDHEMELDIALCQEYTLDVFEIEHEYDKTQDESKISSSSNDTLFVVRDNEGNAYRKQVQSSIVPIGFCGIHNPRRQKSLYGCTPAADTLKSFIRIPYQT